MSKESNNQENIIKQVETEWRDRLFKNTQSLFQNCNLPSHNEWHHLRVWKHAYEILNLLRKNGIEISKKEILELMIAVFFHDTGLCISPGPDHGKYSREICEKFLAEEKIQIPINTCEILEAIEYRDDKSYIRNNPLVQNQHINISGILNVSDDLDAFGICGVFRYAEIYLLRNIKPIDLAGKIIPNLNKRYNNFVNQCGDLQELIALYQPEYKQCLSFFEQLDDIFQKKSISKKEPLNPEIILKIQKKIKEESFIPEEAMEILLA